MDALFQSAFDAVPFRRGDNPRNQVEGKNPFRTGGIAVHVEGNTELQ